MICTVWRKILFPFLSLTLRAIWCVCVCVYICIYVCMYVYIFKNIFHLVVSFPFFLRKNLFRLFELSLYTSNLQICSPIRFSFFLSFFLRRVSNRDRTKLFVSSSFSFEEMRNPVSLETIVHYIDRQNFTKILCTIKRDTNDSLSFRDVNAPSIKSIRISWSINVYTREADNRI